MPSPRATHLCWPWTVVTCVLYLSLVLHAEVLTPPYFNIATNRRITASATCGDEGPELYCKLVGANADTDENINSHFLIKGQVCDVCDPSKEGKAHPPEHAIDGSDRWWQSPPLSRGMAFNEVNLTIDLGQEFHVAYVFIVMANSPRPGVWVLERSIDNGLTYKPWQYFADSPAECERVFGIEGDQSIKADDDVVCSTQFSKVVPLEGGEIVVKLLANRPSASDFFSSQELQEWTRATNVRMRLLRTKTLLGHLMSVARQDPSVTRRYFYSIKDISIGGRCRCNGHATLCNPDPTDSSKHLCECEHNTYGAQCEQCHPLYVQKAWRPSTKANPFVCERCNCFGHADECIYDPEVDEKGLSLDLEGIYSGGGVCQNCRHNTEGINCDKCKPGYFRPYDVPLESYDVCQPCDCNKFFSTGNCEQGSGRCECKAEFLPPNCDDCNVGYYDYPNCKPCDCNRNGTVGEKCEVGGGQCPCKPNFAGKNCDMCAEGYYNFPECLPCECDMTGSASPLCHTVTGECECADNYGGRTCSVCADGYYGYPTCTYCQCDTHGTREGICNKDDGSCLCREGYGGLRCDQCVPSYYGHPECKFCNCSAIGSATTICDATGKCPCLPNFSGRTCDQCAPGYYKFPECLACDCDTTGSLGVSCDDEGKCHCKSNFDGLRCEECKEGFYIHPLCEECNCNPAGVIETFSGCGDSPPGELCQCKSRVQGRICNTCKPLYWNLQQNNPEGCQDCDCHIPGVLGGVGVCDTKNGECPCKNNVNSRRCHECLNGYFNLTADSLLGCQDCMCDPGGSASDYCDKDSGQCDCRPRVTGRSCDQPLQTHYFPTLHQYQFEAEDGTTVSGGPVRFQYNEADFPGYSWRGYAVYSQLQPQTNHQIYVEKSSLYRVVLRYVNLGENTVVGDIIASPDNPNEAEMKYKVKFDPTGRNGTFLTVLQAGNIPAPFVLNPGRWHMSIKSENPLLIDYFVLLPEAYYEASILQQRISEPCSFNVTNASRGKVKFIPEPCVLLKYPSIQAYEKILGTDIGVNPKSYMSQAASIKPIGDDPTTLELLDRELTVISPDQKDVELELPISNAGRHALVLEYFTPTEGPATELNIETTSKKGTGKGRAVLHSCKYATPCRQVMTTDLGEVAVFKFDNNAIKVNIQAADDIANEVAVVSLTAIPMGKWALDYVRPQEFCVVTNGSCTESAFISPPDSVKVEAETGNPDRILPTDNLPNGIMDKSVVSLSGEDRMVNIPGKVSYPGWYMFAVQYYQPESPGFVMDVVVKNGHHQEGRIPVIHCPNIVGCRSLVQQDDKNERFYLDNDFELTLKSPKDVLIDYVLVIPYTDQSRREMDTYLQLAPMDQTRKFIAECGKNHMYIPHNTSEFCRKSVFSLATEYNNGALRCQCEVDGSLSFECDPFGGQCPCKNNVIGRRCERCKTGFFGYPFCKQCDCPPTALCDPDTGDCICPPRVTGAQCDKCEPFTYGFDALIGCEECACNPVGVERGNLQCDSMTGKCECRPNVVGRACNNCANGYWAFPYCQLCNCDYRGTTDNICNEENAECYCKTNVEGRMCDTCKIGNFNLDQENPNGCTKCFCFGKTSTCASSSLSWAAMSAPGPSALSTVVIDVMHHFVVKELDRTASGEEMDSEVSNLIVLPEEKLVMANDSHIQYIRIDFGANHLASYGGYISYRLELEPDYGDDERSTEFRNAPALVLEGRELSPSTNSIYFMHYLENDAADNTTINVSVQLIEEKFRVPAGSRGTGHSMIAPTRDQMMILLKELKAVYIRTSYWQKTKRAALTDFSMDIGVSAYRNDTRRATSVEQCQCPPNYRGLSCEECAEGYYRTPNGLFGGSCVPCQCNGHSDTCDPVSGVCNNCQHNTAGDHCEKCDVGYHGDATQGTPMDCLICACPLPYPSNNFATSCELSSNDQEIACTCRPGYFGLRCESCDAGFYGRPEVLGDYCKPCECSGNIDPTDRYSCDTVTGRCLKCLNNTGGDACAYCAPWHYGDPINEQFCQPCACDQYGTYECVQETGQCKCLPNVEGVLCNRCAPEHYGLALQDGQGCKPCQCGLAAEGGSCEDATGQCKCKRGTTGRTCDRCAPGFWNYSEDGCIPCQCNSEYAVGVGCDPETGQCSCLPGVIGEKCDRCPYRWVLIEGRGCQECETCQHQLLDSIDGMMATLKPVKDEFQSVAAGYFTTQKLTYFNDTAASLEPEVQMLDPSRVDLKPYSDRITTGIQEHKSAKKRADVSNDSLKDKVKASAKLRQKSQDVEKAVLLAVGKTQSAVFEAKDLLKNLDAKTKFTSPQTEAALAEANNTLNTMKEVRLNSDDAMEEKKTAEKLLREMNQLVAPVRQITAKIKNDKGKIESIREKLADLRNQSDYSRQVSVKTNEIIKQIKEDKYLGKKELLETRVNQMTSTADQTRDLKPKTDAVLLDLENALGALSGLVQRIDDFSKPLEENVAKLQDELDDNVDTVQRSRDHVKTLEKEADALNSLLSESIAASENSVNAATAYTKIVEAVNEASSEAAKAGENAKEAAKLIEEITGKAKGAVEPSSNLLTTAREKTATVDQGLKIPLDDAKIYMEEIERTKNETEAALVIIDRELDKVSFPRTATDIEGTIDVSQEAIVTAEEALGSVEDLLDRIPKQAKDARKLPVTIKDLNGGVQISHERLREAEESVPLSEAIAGSLSGKKPDIDGKKEDLKAKLNDLRAKILTAREQANRVPVGMHFDKSSSLMLDNPPSLESQQYQSDVSFYFKTMEPNGLLLFIGNEPGSRENDFMAVEINRGYPTLSLDLGSGAQVIRNDKFVADDTWHKATIERTGKAVKFTISEEDQSEYVRNYTAEGYITGPNSMFNVHKNSSRIYVGGLPESYGETPVRFSSYVGVIEDLRIGEEKVGLWNFKESQHVNPATERDKFVVIQSQGLRFLGKGFAKLDKRLLQFRDRSAIQLSFKTKAPNGLLFMVNKGDNFLAIEINNGKVVYQHNLGSGTLRIETDRTYNDDQWHQVDTARLEKTASLNVDSVGIARKESPGDSKQLIVSDEMFFGGYPTTHDYPEVTQAGFEGCIDSVTIAERPIDLKEALETRHTSSGCPTLELTQDIVNFYGSGYVEVQPGEEMDVPLVAPQDESFELDIRLRTNKTSGLIFYGANSDQTAELMVQLSNGALVIGAEPENVEIRTDRLNDGEWHVATVRKTRDELSVNIDDATGYRESIPASAPLYLSAPGSLIFFGGAPSDMSSRGGLPLNNLGFEGCMGDIVFNGRKLHFDKANVRAVKSKVSHTCMTDQPVLDLPPYVKSTEDPPYGEPEPGITTTPKDVTTTDTTASTTITTTKAPKIKPPPPKPFEQCSLPYRKLETEVSDDEISMEIGVRFGRFKISSRMEFQTTDDDKSRSDYSIDFKTDNPDGLIFFRSDLYKADYVALFIRKGILHFRFDSGSGPAILNSTKMLNDSQWHSVQFSRNKNDGILQIDNEVVATGKSPGSTNDINAGPTLYVGGLPAEAWKLTTKKLLAIDSAFKGCLRNFLIRNKPAGRPTLIESVEPCSDDVESGYFFYPEAGFIKLSDSFLVGQRIKLSLKIKPRHNSGVILAVHGTTDYMILQMINGTVKFTVNNGDGPFASSFSKGAYHLCDGKWHTISATKMKNVVTLAIDTQHSEVGVGKFKSLTTNTNNSPLYLGGLPKVDLPGVETPEQFVGCIKDFVLEKTDGRKRPFKVNYNSMIGTVALHSCPAD